MLSYRRVHDLEDWSQHWNGRGLICTPSSLHLGIFIQLIFFLHNSSKINGTYNMILSICLVKIQYSLVLGCQFSVSPSLDTIPMDRISLASDSCAPQLWTQQSCSSFTLPDILGHRLLVTFLFPCGDIQSILRAAAMFFLILQLFHQMYTFFFSVCC